MTRTLLNCLLTGGLGAVLLTGCESFAESFSEGFAEGMCEGAYLACVQRANNPAYPDWQRRPLEERCRLDFERCLREVDAAGT